jgi:hypothetical protein
VLRLDGRDDQAGAAERAAFIAMKADSSVGRLPFFEDHTIRCESSHEFRELVERLS